MIKSNKNNKIRLHNNPKAITFQDFFSFENIWKLAILGFMMASLYLQNNFITKSEYTQTEERVRKIELILGQLEIKNQIDSTQNKTLELVEIRLRQIEQLVAILDSKKSK